MKSAAIAVSMFFGMAPSAAFASDWPIFDWSIKASESETVELNSNQFLKITGGFCWFLHHAKDDRGRPHATSKLDLDGDGTYKKYWGPGVDGPPSEFLNYGFKAHYEVDEKQNSIANTSRSSWRQQSTALAILNDIGVAVKPRVFSIG